MVIGILRKVIESHGDARPEQWNESDLDARGGMAAGGDRSAVAVFARPRNPRSAGRGRIAGSQISLGAEGAALDEGTGEVLERQMEGQAGIQGTDSTQQERPGPGSGIPEAVPLNSGVCVKS